MRFDQLLSVRPTFFKQHSNSRLSVQDTSHSLELFSFALSPAPKSRKIQSIYNSVHSFIRDLTDCCYHLTLPLTLFLLPYL